MRRYWPVLILALAPLIPLWRAVFLGEAIGPFDQIRQMAPWNGPAPAEPWDVLQADAVLQFYVWRDLVFDAWSKGQAPLWNPYQLGGTPLLANSQSAGFYPPHILMGLLRAPTAPAITLLAWLHLFWAGLGVYGLTRRIGGSALGATVAGASFALSAFMVSWIGLASVISTVSWIPWLLIGVWDLSRARERGGGGAGGVALTGMAGAMMLLAGHLQFAAYGFMAAFLLALWLAGAAWQDSRRRSQEREGHRGGRAGWAILLLAASGLAMAAALAAPQLLPVLSYSRFSHRAGAAPTEEGYQAYVASSIKAFELPTLAHPGLYGLPTRRSTQDNGLSEYWPAAAKRGGNYAESAIGLGPLVLLLLLALPWRRVSWRRAGGIGIIGALALLLALGTPLNRLLYFLLPGWSSTGSPGRAGVIFVLCACVLAGLALGSEERGARAKSAPPILLAIGTALALYAGSMAWQSLEPWVPAFSDARLLGGYAMASLVASLPPLAFSLVAAIAVWLIVGRDSVSNGARVGVAAAAAVATPLALYAGSLLRTSPEVLPRIEAAPFERVAAVNEPWELLAAAPAVLPPNTSALSRVAELGGYDSLMHRETKAMIDKVNGQDSAPPANGNMAFVKRSASAEELLRAGVTRVWSRVPLENLGLGSPRLRPDGLLEYDLSPLPGAGRASTPVGGASFVSEDYVRKSLRAEGPGELRILDRALPGWEASVDGRPWGSEPGPFFSLDLPAGEHSVELRYRAPGLGPGLAVGGTAWLAAAGLLVAGRTRRRRGQDTRQSS